LQETENQLAVNASQCYNFKLHARQIFL